MDFVGKSGDPVRRCLKCREKDAKQKKTKPTAKGREKKKKTRKNI
jgi:hypothetical protein